MLAEVPGEAANRILLAIFVVMDLVPIRSRLLVIIGIVALICAFLVFVFFFSTRQPREIYSELVLCIAIHRVRFEKKKSRLLIYMLRSTILIPDANPTQS